MSPVPPFSSAPFPGLRPFETEEQDIFFGREAQTDQLLTKLQNSRILAVVGPSGCGKSSLVRAGLIACLETGMMASAGSRWRVVTMRPGRSPIGSLARRLAPEGGGTPEAPTESQLSIEAALRRGPLGLIDCVRESAPTDPRKLLLLVDQFEELFRFRVEQSADEADAFVDLLLASARQHEVPIYVVLTMRSDFLGQCALFHGLPEAISESQYLTPRLTREECARAIVGPARVFGGEVEGALVHRLLNDLGPDSDQLPVMQHVLMRLWSIKRKYQPEGRIVLAVDGYEAIGGLSRALSRHADEALLELSERGQALSRVLFQRISSRTAGQLDTRSPATAGEIAHLAGATVAEIAAVADAFRRPDRSFLTPPAGEPIEGETFLDVGHESFITHWDRLSGWVREENESATVYARLKQEAKLWRAGEAALWGSPNLERALDWKQRTGPNAAWAERYGSPADFDLAMEFLSASEARRRDEQGHAEAARKRQLRRARWVAGASGLIAVSLALGIVVYRYRQVVRRPGYFASFVVVRGATQGGGPLSREAIAHRPRSFRVTTRGSRGPVLLVEAIDARDQLTPGIIWLFDRDPGPDDVAATADHVYDERGQPVATVHYDEHHACLSGIQYVSSGAPDDATTTFYKVGRDGTPDPKAPLVRVEYSPRGDEHVLRYRDALTAPVPGPSRAFGLRREFDEEGRVLAWTWLGADDLPMSGAMGFATFKSSYDASGNDVLDEALDTAGRPTFTTEGWAARRRAYDGFGNVVSESYFDVEGHPTIGTGGYHRIAMALDERGNAAAKSFWSADAQPATNEIGCYAMRERFDDRGNSVESTCTGADGKVARTSHGYASWQTSYDDHRHLLDQITRDPDGHECISEEGFSHLRRRYDPDGHLTDEQYAGPDGTLVPCPKGFARLHMESDREGHVLLVEYFASDGTPTPSDDGYAKIKRSYDAVGNVVDENYFGGDWKPASDASGCAGFRARYDPEGNPIEHELLAAEPGERCESSEHYAGWRSTFERGDETQRRYFGLRGEPVIGADGYASWNRTYDARGKVTDESYLDVDGAPALFKWQNATEGQGYARVATKFDPNGDILEVRYFGKNGEPVVNERGTATVKMEYDERRHMTKFAVFGRDGKPVLDNQAHLVRFKNDEHGNVLELEYFGLDGSPTTLRRGPDKRPGIDPPPYVEMSRSVGSYDAYGRQTEERGFIGDNPAPLDGGCMVLRTAYDAWGHPTALECRRLDGALDGDSNGIAVIRYTYDAHGRKVETSFHWVNGALVVGRKEKYAVRKSRYDERGNEVDVELLDAEGRLASGGPPAHRVPK